jgi:hypothetical protein
MDEMEKAERDERMAFLAKALEGLSTKDTIHLLHEYAGKRLLEAPQDSEEQQIWVLAANGLIVPLNKLIDAGNAKWQAEWESERKTRKRPA